MPKYRVLEKSLIGNEIHEAGAIVDYDGLPAENLEPMCKEGEAKYKEYVASNTARAAAMKEQFSESAVGDPAVFVKNLAQAMAAANAEVISSAVAQGIAQAMASLSAAQAAVEAPTEVLASVDAPAPSTKPTATTKNSGSAKDLV